MVWWKVAVAILIVTEVSGFFVLIAIAAHGDRKQRHERWRDRYRIHRQVSQLQAELKQLPELIDSTKGE